MSRREGSNSREVLDVAMFDVVRVSGLMIWCDDMQGGMK